MVKISESKKNNKRVALGLSGGVDSSVAAYLLKKEGYDVTGVYMQCWDFRADGCNSDRERNSAVSVAENLDIKFEYLNFIKEYKERVIKYFYSEYKQGRTPNPDVMCNKEIKFGIFLEWALKNGFDLISTGHYANTRIVDGRYLLVKGKDKSKDQSYFLYRLTQEQLSKVIFPIGNLIKSSVRQIAKDAGLLTYNKPDSQGICFIGEVDIKKFLMKQISPKKGKLLFTDGSVIGEHDGVWFYTIGQRHGFTTNKYFGLPLYVVGKDVAKNELIVGYAKDVLKDNYFVEDIHWINMPQPEDFRCDVRIRHLGKLYKSFVKVISEGKLEVKMESKSFGVAPGQSAVFYKGSVVLGGGIISG